VLWTAINRQILVSPARRGSQRGASLVEYAFVVVLSLTVLFGASGFGHALYVYHALNNAAKEGTRWAAVNGKTCSDDSSCSGTNGMNNGPATTSDIQTYVSNQLPSGVDSSQATVTATFLAPTGSPPVCTTAVTDVTTGALIGPYNNYPGCTIKVEVDYTYSFIFPFISTSQINMSSTSEMVIIH
jgi:Flp pilus assembly protein TadG